MDEEVDILTDSGDYTGTTCLKSEAHKNGWCHPTVHVWLYSATGKVLLQQRGKHKKTFPLLWDVSVAGHVGSGEDILSAARREVQEEVGYTIREEELEKIGVFKEVHRHRPDFTDCEFHHTFIAPLKVGIDQLTREVDEVEQLALKPILQLSEEAWGMAKAQDYVPHSADYYKAVFSAIKNRL